MHQQNCKQQVAKRSISVSWYNILMPTDYAVPFSNETNDDIITRLCKANE